jgi:hypothetical protein
MKNERNDHFVEDGYERAWSGNYDAIHAEVAREYAERLQSAGLFERWWLHWEMRQEIERRLDRVAPPWGTYFSP